MTIDELVQAHLINVQQELFKLKQSQKDAEQEIVRLTEYLREGASLLEQYRTSEEAKQASETVQE
jgi:hypothetical protein